MESTSPATVIAVTIEVGFDDRHTPIVRHRELLGYVEKRGKRTNHVVTKQGPPSKTRIFKAFSPVEREKHQGRTAVSLTIFMTFYSINKYMDYRAFKTLF
jgi:hypothetical protein